MEEEDDFGNIEYKRHLLDLNDDKIISYSSQLKFRLKEGNHICYYYIGLNDNGSIYGLVDSVENTINNFKKIVSFANAFIEEYEVINNDFIRFKITDIKYIPEYRIILQGDNIDDKNNFINYCLFNKAIVNKNEYNTINYYSFGINNDKLLNYNNCDDISEIIVNSDKLIYLVDIKKKDLSIINSINPIYRLIFINNENEIVEEDSRVLYLIKNNEIDYKIDNNIYYYNDLKYDNIHKILTSLLYYEVYDRHINSLTIINVLYSFSQKKYLLIVLANIAKDFNYESLTLITEDESIKGTLDSIYLTDIKQDKIKNNNTTYTIIIDFEKNVNKLKNKIILLNK